MTRYHRFTATASLFASALVCFVLACSGGSDQTRQLARADTLLRAGKYSAALDAAQPILARNETNPDANHLLGAVRLELGQSAQAYHHLLIALNADAQFPEVRAALGRLYLTEGQYDEARAQALEILAGDPRNTQGLVLLAASASSSTDIDDAIRRLEAARSSFGSDARPRLALASLYQRKNNPSSAAGLYQEAVTQDAKSAEAHSLLAAFYASKGNAPQSAEETKAADALTPRDSVGSASVALSLVSYGQRDLAARLLNDLVQHNPTASPARRMMAELALGDSNATLADETIRPLLQRDSNDAEALLQRARVRIIQGKPTDAVADIRRVLADLPNLAPARYQLGIAYTRLGKIKEAQVQFDSAIKVTGSYPEAVTELAALNIRADIPRASIADAERVVQLNPMSLSARRVLGNLYLAARRPSDASETYRQIIKLAPDRREPHYWLGVSLAAEGRKAEATAELESALKLSPDFVEPLGQLVSMSMAEGHSDAALQRVEAQTRAAPQSARLFSLLATVHEQRNESDAAEAAYTKAVQLDPKLVEARVGLAELAIRRGKLDLAVSSAQAARDIDPRNLSALIALGAAHQQKGEVQPARQAYEQALAVQPGFAPAANDLALLLSESGSGSDQREAVRYAAMALQGAPNDPRVKDTAGWILFKSGDAGSAFRLLQESVDQLPNEPDIQYHLGMAAQRVGDTVTARRALEKAASSTVDFPGKADARKALTLLK